jgi:hypothetical protein
MQQLRRAAPVLVGALLVAAPRLARAEEPEPKDSGERRASPNPGGVSGGDPPTAKDPDEARAADEAKREEEARYVAAAKGVKLSFRLGVRFLQTAPFSKVYQHVLNGYGYGSMSAILESAADVAVSPWRWIDLGFHAGYDFGSAGTSGGSGGLMTLHVAELGGFAYFVYGRDDRRRPGTIAGGVEGGAMLPFLVLRGDATSARLPYIGPVVLLRLLGDAKVQPTVQVRYVVANWGNAFGTVGLPLGGFSISAGANLSL